VSGGPYDTHELATHAQAPGRLWSAAGDGFFESENAGNSWRKCEDGPPADRKVIGFSAESVIALRPER
jgi:hypothetical protein